VPTWPSHVRFYTLLRLAVLINTHATVILSYILSRSRTGFRKTDTIINRLIRGAIQTGLFASLFALADLFSFVLLPGTNFYAMFAYPIGRIYTNVRFFLLFLTDPVDIATDLAGYP
jgi:hypothetical protein